MSARRERVGQDLPRLVAHEAHLLDLEQPRELLQLVAPRAAADQHDPQVVEVAQERRRADQRVEVLRVADVAGVHDDELVDELVLARPRRCRAGAARASSMSTQFGITTIRSPSRALRLEPLAHRLADRDDAVGALEVEADREPQRSDHDARLSSRFSSTATSGKTSWLIDDERRAEPARDEQRDVGDHRRIGHAEHDVGPLDAKRLHERQAEIRQVVRRAQREPAAVERGRADAHDLDAVPRRSARRRRPGRPSRSRR